MQLLNGAAGRRGYTLVELMVALVMAAVLSYAVLKVFITNQRFSDSLAQRVDVQQNLRTAMAILPADFRQLDAADGDIKAMNATSITIRAMRQVGIVCTSMAGLPAGIPGTKTITVRRPLYSGRDFLAPTGANYDSVFVWNEGAPGSRTDDGWWPGRVTAAPNLNCTDGTPGQQLSLLLQAPPAPQVNVATSIPLGAPVRGFETVTYTLAQAADTRWYLNMTTNNGSGTSATQPIIGPLIGNNGIAFTYWDAAGAVTAVPANVRQIGITIRGQSVRTVHRPGPAIGRIDDSVSTRITLRNNPRY
jgi:prepilin-type N-terminal cleavage/methylation domain-containing protein